MTHLPSALSIERRPNRRPLPCLVERLEPRQLLSTAIKSYPVPTADSVPYGITSGPDGNLWFTESAGNEVGRISPVTCAITEFALTARLSAPLEIASGP